MWPLNKTWGADATAVDRRSLTKTGRPPGDISAAARQQAAHAAQPCSLSAGVVCAAALAMAAQWAGAGGAASCIPGIPGIPGMAAWSAIVACAGMAAITAAGALPQHMRITPANPCTGSTAMKNHSSRRTRERFISDRSKKAARAQRRKIITAL